MSKPHASVSGVCSPYYKVLGIPLRALEIPELIGRVEGWIQAREYGHCITFANVHVVMESQHDPALNALLKNSMMLNVPDGKPLVWLARAKGLALQRRVYGPDVMKEFCASTKAKGYRHFLYGGASGVPEKLAMAMARDYPGINVVGTYSPPFRPLSAVEDRQIVEMINAACPDVLWIGLGCPKQEKWAFEHRNRLEVPVLASVGQAFDIHAGVVQQAPLWMRENGLEWLFRLVHNPRRLWKRYLIYNSEFVWCVLLEMLDLKRFSQL